MNYGKLIIFSTGWMIQFLVLPQVMVHRSIIIDLKVKGEYPAGIKHGIGKL